MTDPYDERAGFADPFEPADVSDEAMPSRLEAADEGADRADRAEALLRLARAL